MIRLFNKKKRKETDKTLLQVEGKDVEDVEDIPTIIDSVSLTLFAKHYIMSGGNGTAAYRKLRPNTTYASAAVGANRYLRQLRNTSDNFFDIIGLGYNNLKEVVDILKKTKPEKAIDIIMKVNKEDITRFEDRTDRLIINVVPPPSK